MKYLVFVIMENFTLNTYMKNPLMLIAYQKNTKTNIINEQVFPVIQ